MRLYTKRALKQLSKWYQDILVKCAILNAAIWIAGTLATPSMARDVDTWAELNAAVADTTTPNTINITGDITAESNFNEQGATYLTIDGNGNSLTGRNASGDNITVGDNQTLNLNNI